MNNTGFWIPLIRHFLFLLLLLIAPLGIHCHGNRGDCSHVANVSLKLICNSRVPDYIYSLYRDMRAPAKSSYSVWQSEASDTVEDMIVLVSFHDNYLHRYESMMVENFHPADTYHTFNLKSSSGVKTIQVRPSLLHCFSMGLRYPMELKANCLGQGRSQEVAPNPILHYAMHEIKTGKHLGSIASTLNPWGSFMIVASTSVAIVVVIGI